MQTSPTSRGSTNLLEFSDHVSPGCKNLCCAQADEQAVTKYAAGRAGNASHLSELWTADAGPSLRTSINKRTAFAEACHSREYG
jgi:hypothetical protein